MGCGCNKNNSVQINRTALSKCPELYEILRQLDLKVINLMNIENTKILQETNSQLRMWMRNLNSYCPTEEEIEIVREFINKEENK